MLNEGTFGDVQVQNIEFRVSGSLRPKRLGPWAVASDVA